ncbi:MAG TPA: helix-turn-helix transcriptional regulator, partial [Beutenbergiaceae bacterium]|nr:helix-turn-helix transcriptional regulator [Beutenbergiaceae bacterium]
MAELGRDRLRELLDAVLDEDHTGLGAMAAGAFTTPWHFSRQLSRGAGEPPVALRRRVVMERAAWQLKGGSSVTEVAFDSGYDSVEGFSRAFLRAFGYPPRNIRPTTGKAATRAHWLPAPNGIHFHPPMHLWVSEQRQHRGNLQVVAQLVQHDLA